MIQKQILGAIVLAVYILTQLFSVLGAIKRDQGFAAEGKKNTMNNLIAVLVDEKIYDQISGNINRYATKYIQQKYSNSKALVLKINTSEYTAPEIVKLLENLYFDGEKDISSQLIGLVLIGDIPLPVLKYDDYIFPSIYPYVDFLEQKYIRNEESGYFEKDKESGEAEIWHGVINFKSDSTKYNDFFKKLQNYDKNPAEFIDKKIRYDDMIALQNNFLDEGHSLYQNKLLFSEDLIYNRYTDLLYKTIQSDQSDENNQLLSDLENALNTLGDKTNLSGISTDETKTPTLLLKQKTESLTKDYISSISTKYQNIVNENINASDRRTITGADAHYKKLQLKDQLLLGTEDTNGILRSINDQLEKFVDTKVKKENYAMKSVIPTLYKTEKFYRKKILIKSRYLPDFKDTFKFYYFGQDAETLENAEQASIFRGTFRNLQEIGTYSSIISDPQNPAKTSTDKTNLTSKSIGASYDLFSTQVEANRAFNLLSTEQEYQLYQKEKTFAKFESVCKKRRFGLPFKFVPCQTRVWKGEGKCNPNSSNMKDHADCETFQQFGNRVRGGATPLNVTGVSDNSYRIQGNYDPKSAWKPIFSIAGSIALDKAETPATTFQGLNYYLSPTKTEAKEGTLKDATEHIDPNKVDYFKISLTNTKITKNGSGNFTVLKPKNSRTDVEHIYKYRIIDSTIKHTATTATQLNGLQTTKYGEGSENYSYYQQLKESLTTPKDEFSPNLLKTFANLESKLNQIKEQIDTAGDETNINKLFSTDLQTELNSLLSGTEQQFDAYTQLVSTDYSSSFTNTIEGIRVRQIEKDPKIGLYITQYKTLLQTIANLKTFLNTQKSIAEGIFSRFKKIADLNENIQTSMNSKIEKLTTQITSLKQQIPQNTTQISQLEKLLSNWENAKKRSEILANKINEINQISQCDSNHGILGTMLGKNESEIKQQDSSTIAECKDEDTQNTAGQQESSTNKITEMTSDLTKAEAAFKALFFADQNNDSISIEGASLITQARPIDSPRYLSFQGVGGNPIKLIYPNMFKAEAFIQTGNALSLKTPDQFKTALKTYLQNKVAEYNTILMQEKAKALPNTTHFTYLKSIDPLATPNLENTVRSYQPFTYEEMLSSIGGEKMLNTLAYLLYYHNTPITNRTISDDIKQDLKLTKQAFNINNKIGTIFDDYLTQSADAFLNQKAYSGLILPNHTKKGYEVGFINSSENDIIATKDSFKAEDEKPTIDQPNQTEKNSPLEDQNKKEELECGFSYNEALLLFDISKMNSPWLNGFKCRRKATVKKPFELSLSRENDSLLSKLITPEDPSVDGDLISVNTTPTPSFGPDKIIGTVLEKIALKPESVGLTVGETGSKLILQTYASENEPLTVSILSTGGNCLLVNGKSSCKTKATISGKATNTGWEIPISLANPVATGFQATIQVCGTTAACGQKTYTFTATPAEIKSFEIDLGEKRQFAAGVYSLIFVKALDQYKNQVSKSFYPYVLTASKGGFIVGGESKKSIEITDFKNTNIIYRAETSDVGTVRFTIQASKTNTENKKPILGQNEGTILPAKLSIQHNNQEKSEIDYHLTSLPTYLKNGKVNENKALKLQIKLLDPQNQTVTVDVRAATKTKNHLIQTYILDKNDQKLKETSAPVLKNGVIDLYLLTKGIAGEEELSITIPGLKEQKIKLAIHPGNLDKIKIKLNQDFAPAKTPVQGTIELEDTRGNPIQQSTDIELLSIGKEQTITKIKNSKGKISFSTAIPEGLSQITLQATVPNSDLKASTTLKLKKNFLSNAVNSGLNVMYLNFFGSDRGNQRGYLSENKGYSEHIIEKSPKTLAITTQLIDLKKLAKPSILFLENGKILQSENLEISANLKGNKLEISLGNIGKISILDPIKKIIQTSNADISLQKITEKSLLITNLNENYSLQNQKLYSAQGNQLASFSDGLTFSPTQEENAGFTKRELLFNGEAIADAYFPKINFTLSTAQIQDPLYKFGPTFQQGSTNHSAQALFNTSNLLSDTYKGYASIQNSDEIEQYIGFRGDFKNITNFAAGKTVGEATIPFGSEFLINIGDPLLKRIDKNENIENAQYNGGLEKVVYSDSDNNIFKVIDIDYNNDKLRDLLIIYNDGSVKLQKQYADKNFKNMEQLLFTAQQIEEVYVGDLDGNSYEDILIKSSNQQLRAYLNTDGKFPVDGQIICLNTNTEAEKTNPQPQYLSGVVQFFLKDMNVDGTSDIITYDKSGDLKIFYGAGNKNNHSYLSQNAYSCDDKWFERQKNHINLVTNLGIQLLGKEIRDASLVRRAGLKMPNQEELANTVSNSANQELSSSIPASMQNQMTNPSTNFNTSTLANIGNYFNANTNAQNALAIFERYTTNPFQNFTIFNDGITPENQSYLQIDKLATTDPVQITKKYTDLNGGKLLDGDRVKITVTLQTNLNTEISFFDTIEGPWKITLETSGQPQNFKFEEGSAQFNRKILEYPYYLTNFQPSTQKRVVWSYEVQYQDAGAAYTIDIEDKNILDYQYQPKIIKQAPKDGYKADQKPDISISPKDGCNKTEAIFFNTGKNHNKDYILKNINLQELSDAYSEERAKQQQKNQEQFTSATSGVKENGLNSIPGLSSIGEKINTKDFLEGVWEKGREGGSFDFGNIKVVDSLLSSIGINNADLEKVEENLTNIANAACHGFSFGDKGNSCQGLPVPFNQGFLGPGQYHIMGCFPLEPLTRTLGKGLPVFHFPGTIYTPVGALPIPRGLKSHSDGFLWAGGGTYTSMVRIYAVPTLTAKMGIAVCMGPYGAGINMPSPIADIAGNCVVTAVSLPCSSKNGEKSDGNQEELYSRAKDYGETKSCQSSKASPFSSTIKTPSNNSSTENATTSDLFPATSLFGVLTIDQEHTILDANDLNTQGGIIIQAPQFTKNKIIGGLNKGVKEILVGFLDKQIEYIKNNLLRREFNLYLPDVKKLSNQISSVGNAFNKQENSEATKLTQSLEKNNLLSDGLKNFLTNSKNLNIKKSDLTQINLLNGENLFTQMKTLFNQTEIIAIRTQDITIQVPWIYSEDIEAYKNHLQIRLETQKTTLKARENTINTIINLCPGELKKLQESGESRAYQEKLLQCRKITETAQKVVKLTADLEKTSGQIMQNILVLEKYKRFPLELYEYIHIIEKYMTELSSVITNFFGYINYRMDLNATRFSQYVDAIVTILAIVKTYQMIVDFSENRGNKCGTCTNDTYDQYTCKLSFLCSAISIDPLPIPNIKLPNLTVDLSHVDLGLDLVLPNFRFAPKSIDLVQLPNLPQPPALGLDIDINFEIPDLPLLPEPPTLPPLPSILPKVNLSLPVLPPAPKIPEIPKEITAVLDLASTLGQIYCIVKQGFGLVGESAVKAKVEQITQRTYDVPRVDHLDLGSKINAQLRKSNLKGVDYQIDSYVNLQYNFDQFYAFLKGITDEINTVSTSVTSLGNNLVNTVNQTSNIVEGATDSLINEIPTNLNVNLNVPLSYQNSTSITKNTTKSDLKKQLTQVLQKTTSETEKTRIQELINLTNTNTQINTNKKELTKINTQVQQLITKHSQSQDQLSNLIKNDYKTFLLTLDDQNKKQSPYQLTYTTNLLNKDTEIEHLLKTQNPSKIYIQTESKNVEGYLKALDSHTPSTLNMTQEVYDKSRRYLLAISSHIKQFNAISSSEYAGQETLITKDAQQTVQKPLVADTSTTAKTTTKNTTDYSSYIKGILVKTTDNQSLINVVNSEYNYERYQSHYAQDMNSDKKSDLILRDQHTVWIKYADDAETQPSNTTTKYYLISPNLKNRDKEYESSNGSAFKLYDKLVEVKNFKLNGQSFDNLTLSRDNNQSSDQEGFLIRVSDRIDMQKEKFNTDKYRYILFLPQGSETSNTKLEYQNGKSVKIDSLLKANMILEQQTYNPSSQKLTLGVSELPRERQYLQIAHLKKENNEFRISSPWSNQILGGRQILGDTQSPIPEISLVRTVKNTTVDRGNELNGFVGTYYTLQIDRKDNVQVGAVAIKEKNKILAEKTINAQQGTISISNLFFTQSQTKNYTITAVDSEGNYVEQDIVLSINAPLISIENIARFSGRKEGLKNPVSINALLETDIDRGTVSFERERNQTLTTISATLGGKKISNFPVSTDQIAVTGAYFDYGNLIGMFSQTGVLYGNIDAENGEITLLPKFKDSSTLEVSFEKHYPTIKLIRAEKTLFEIMLTPQSLIDLKVKKGELLPLTSSKFGNYQNGKVLMLNKKPILYIGPNGQLSSPENLYGTYAFNEKNQSVIYTLYEHRFGEEIASVEIKVKPM